MWNKDGTVVRAVASHQCGPGSIPRLSVICGLSLLLVLILAPRSFSPGTLVFPSPQKPTLLNSNSIWIIAKHFHEPLVREIAQAFPVLLTLNKLLYFGDVPNPAEIEDVRAQVIVNSNFVFQNVLLLFQVAVPEHVAKVLTYPERVGG